MSSATAAPAENNSPKTIYLADYQPPVYGVQTIDLNVDIQKEKAIVTAQMQMKARDKVEEPLVLQGHSQTLVSVKVNDQVIAADQYSTSGETLSVNLPAGTESLYTVEITSEIDPYSNTALEGLYESKGMLCTQCEAEGFRRIIYYVDRPDNMAVFTTRIQADKTLYPVLLANGNLVESRDLDNNRHEVVWHDPHPKPSYLFAMVAGDLAVKKDTFTTMSGREVTIAFYTEEQDQDKLDYAIAALKKSMKWDEERYGREYDLDIYMVVAVSHFNMGAMENKGLNVFNTSCVLASPDTATDQQYGRVESIIAHEYFHNWSGNRVTCRDWFQLSLKEGFTVFRDQHFSMDVDSYLEHRVDAVKVMRSIQFAEDAGPMAHPVRPQDYIEINNFYTVTVYDKGAEVVRMYHTLLGDKAFREGTDRYFDRFDGQAVTTEDFAQAVTEGQDFDLPRFQRWYDQPGTPVLTVNRHYDADAQTLTLRFEQHYPELPNWKKDRQPVIIPVKLGLISVEGDVLPLETEHAEFKASSQTEGVFVFKEAADEIVFNNVPEETIPSLLRGFSAPVILRAQYSQQELATLVAHDADLFNRWDAAQNIMSQIILQGASSSMFLEVFGQTCFNNDIDPGARALICQLPSYTALEQLQVQDTGSIQVEQILDGQKALRMSIAKAYKTQLEKLIEQATEALSGKDFSPAPEDRGWRSLRNLAFYFLSCLETEEMEQRLLTQYEQANNLTDRLASFRNLVHNGYSAGQKVIDNFAAKYGHEELAMNAWFEVQASNPSDDCIAQVKNLQAHKAYDPKSPNNVRAVVGAFCRGNPRQFHRGTIGYDFLADTVINYNKSNPQLAARLLGPLTSWRQYDSARQEQMKSALEKILKTDALAPDVYEIVSKSIGA